MAANYLQLAMEETPRYEGAVLTTPYRVSSAVAYFPTTGAHINAVPSHIDRGNELRNITGDVPLVVDTFAPEGSLAERAYINHLVFLFSIAGFKGVPTVGDGVNNIWSLVWAGTPATGGTFTITVGGQVTAPIAYNATVATIQAAVEALSSVGVGNVLVAQASGGPLPANGTITLTFRRALGGLAQTVTTSAAGLTGGAPTITPTSTTAAVAPTVQNPDWITGDTFAAAPQHYVGVGATKWVFSKRTGSVAQTAQMIAAYGDMGVWLKGQGFAVNALALNAQGEMTAGLTGLVVASIADPSLSPVIDSASVLPAKRGDLTLTWLNGGAAPEDFSFSIANSLTPVHSMGLPVPSAFPDLMEFGDDWPKLTGSIPKRKVNTTDYAALLAGTTFAAKARWLGTSYAADSPSRYAVWIEMPAAQLSAGVPADLNSGRRFGATYDFWGAFDETAGYDVRITLVTTVTSAALSTPSFSVV